MGRLLAFLVGCCALTVVLEGLPCLFMAEKKAWWRAGILCNVITNPLLNTLLLLLVSLSLEAAYGAVMCVGEVAVVFAEAFFYQRMLGKSYGQCLAFSLIANGVSFLAGLLISAVL